MQSRLLFGAMPYEKFAAVYAAMSNDELLSVLRKPRTLSPPAPTPAQSLLWAHARVHHAPLHVSPAMHVPKPELHGSPVPDSAQMVHRATWHHWLAR